MALVLADRVKETTTTTGTGTVTLLGASTGFQSFAVVGNTNTTYYTIAAQTGTEWEVGIGTYTLSGTTLARTTVLSSSNSGSPVNFSAGTKDVFVTYPSSRSVYANGTVLTATNSSILPVTSGGTGVTTSTGTTNVVLSNSPTLVTPALGAATATSIVSSGTAASSFTVTSGSAVPLTITNVGTGNSFVVEDSASTDGSPFVITAGGQVIMGFTAQISGAQFNPSLEVFGADSSESGIGQFQYGANTSAARYQFNKTRGATAIAQTVVVSGDELGTIQFAGSDGTGYIRGAFIRAEVDGTPGVNDMPGRLVFSTTADGASTPTERVRIDSAGAVSIGGGAMSGGLVLDITKAQTGAVSGYTVNARINPLADVTSNSTGFQTFAINGVGTSTTNFFHYTANQGTFAGTAPTNQYGFNSSGSITGATNNYGVYSNIASGTNRYNFYAAGTAINFFAGSVGLGSLPVAGFPVNIGYSLTGAATSVNVRAIPTILSDVTTAASVFKTQPFTQATAFTLSNLTHYDATQGTIGASSAVTNQYGFVTNSSLTGATNNYGFYSSIASTANRFNFYAAGTADNYFAGSVGIGLAPTTKFQVYGAGTTAAFYTNGDASGSTAYLQSSGLAAGDGGQILFGALQGVFAGIKGFITNGTGPAGDLIFQTRTSSGNVLERMRIDSTGNVGIGGTAGADSSLGILGTYKSSGAITRVVRINGTIPSATTGTARGFSSELSTEAAAFTLANLQHFYANQSTIGATSAVTNQYGFIAESTLTGATANFGFLSNIAAAVNRWNFYAQGTAANYFAGVSQFAAGTAALPGITQISDLNTGIFFPAADTLGFTTAGSERVRIDSAGSVGIGAVPTAGYKVLISGTASGSTSTFGLYNSQTVDPAVSTALHISFAAATSVLAGTLPDLRAYNAGQGTFTGTVTNQYGFFAQGTLVGATNNYGFFSSIAAAANRWNFYANGTARNYMAADLTVNGATAIPAGGTAGAGLMVSTTANFGVFFGSGAPTLTAAQGSIYLRSDGSSTSTRMYVNTNGSTTWTNVTTAA